jgi:hypothetical protein
MNTTSLIVPQIELPTSALPAWEQFPQECQDELVQVLAAMLFTLPQLQALVKGMDVQGAGHEQQQ